MVFEPTGSKSVAVLTTYSYIDQTSVGLSPIVINSTSDAIVVMGDAVFTPAGTNTMNVGISVTSSPTGAPNDPGAVVISRSMTTSQQVEFAVNGVITNLTPGTYYVGIAVSGFSGTIPLDRALLTAYLIPNAYPPPQ